MAGKADLIDEIHKAGETSSKAHCGRVLDATLHAIGKLVARGEKVTIPGWGKFEPKVRKARTVRNPQTGDPIAVPQRTVVTFKAGKQLAARVNA